jgi:N-acetyl-1-D-myo-inositol-2-amino-2-deoxy-alpha-D-glucopyranoside deacetylase
MSQRTLLAVLAHPDDESFGMGGTLALYASRGVDVYLVCATRGEVGEADEKHLKDFSSIGEMREAELRCAAGILGLKGVFFLGYRDSGMPGSVLGLARFSGLLCLEPGTLVPRRIWSMKLSVS